MGSVMHQADQKQPVSDAQKQYGNRKRKKYGTGCCYIFSKNANVDLVCVVKLRCDYGIFSVEDKLDRDVNLRTKATFDFSLKWIHVIPNAILSGCPFHIQADQFVNR